MNLVKDFRDAVWELGRQADVEIATPGDVELARLGDAGGVVYKSSGAGGGDTGLAFSADGDALRRFAVQATKLGWQALELGPGLPAGRR